jgi:hypothetical protein
MTLAELDLLIAHHRRRSRIFCQKMEALRVSEKYPLAVAALRDFSSRHLIWAAQLTELRDAFRASFQPATKN